MFECGIKARESLTMCVLWDCVSVGMSPDRAACDSLGTDIPDQTVSVTRESHTAWKAQKSNPTENISTNKQITSWQRSINLLKKKWCRRKMWLSQKSPCFSFPSFVRHWARRLWVDSVLWTYMQVHDCTKKSFRKSTQLDSWHVHWHVQMSEIN